MKEKYLLPFTEEEKRTVENNHNLIYAFLHRYGYSIAENYSTALWGYLKGVQAYHRNEQLRKKYDFSYIVWQHMRSEIGNHFKSENAKKRKPEQGTVSFDAEILHNCIGIKSVEDDVMEKELLKMALENLSDTQRKIVWMKIDGYSNKETILFLNIPSSTFYKEIGRIRTAVEKVLVD